MIPIHFQACHSFNFWWFFSLPNIAKKHKFVAMCWKCRNISLGRQCHMNLSELCSTDTLSNQWPNIKENSSNIANKRFCSLSCLSKPIAHSPDIHRVHPYTSFYINSVICLISNKRRTRFVMVFDCNELTLKTLYALLSYKYAFWFRLSYGIDIFKHRRIYNDRISSA